ncbi:MAG TPA: ABC transporter permease, partial [Ktedonobacteraceae bacterium]|nr:ABC transporter permease [Ktedonobacteraceae bacterium]
RLIFILPVALLVSFMTFMLIHLVPGDPARVLLGEEATPQTVAALQHKLGLDRPLPQQFVIWLWQALHGDLGDSIRLQQPVVAAMLQRLPVTLELGIASLLYALLLAIPLGVYSATHRNTWVDWVVNVSSLLGTAIPSFVLALLLIFLFAVATRLFPPGGYIPFIDDPASNMRDLILPMIALGTGTIAVNLRQIRASMIEALEQDYVRTARAKGLAVQRVNYVHALRNALIPLLTIVGLQIGSILGGAFVIETIFLWPGIGQLAVDSIFSKDYPVVQGVVLLVALSYMLTNLLVDISYVILDPRIRLSKS